LAPRPFPTFLAVDESKWVLLTANHGSFDHVEQVVRTPDEPWSVEYVYDDSTVIMYEVDPGGRVGRIRDQVLSGHGRNPNSSGAARAVPGTSTRSIPGPAGRGGSCTS
jgi:6-phosphogluconolactonase